jgi:hypothetical protein
MADTIDPGRPRHLSLQEVIDVLDQLTERLVGDGVEPERVADAYKIAAFRAETLRRPLAHPVSAAAERVRIAAEASLTGKAAYSGPERRGAGRPWSKPSL